MSIVSFKLEQEQPHLMAPHLTQLHWNAKQEV